MDLWSAPELIFVQRDVNKKCQVRKQSPSSTTYNLELCNNGDVTDFWTIVPEWQMIVT